MESFPRRFFLGLQLPKHMKISKKLFIQKFEKNAKNTSKALCKYTENPTDAAIHDMRVTMRRLNVISTILPKKIRINSSRYLEQSWKLFKDNTKVRDCDILLEKLTAYQHDPINQIISLLEKKRKSGLEKCYNDAVILKKLKIPTLKNKKISQSKIQERFSKLVQKRYYKINKLFPIVLQSNKNIEELHLLRKEIKKLRYLIEFLPNSKIKKLVSELKNLQTILGDIHDSDMTMSFLREIKTNNVSIILHNEEDKRSENYEKFVTLVKTQHIYPLQLRVNKCIID